jgi:hypothetical protein
VYRKFAEKYIASAHIDNVDISVYLNAPAAAQLSIAAHI